MPDREQSLGRSPKKAHPLLGSVIAAGLVLAACALPTPNAPRVDLSQGSALQGEDSETGPRLVDSRLNGDGSIPYQRITFSFNPNFLKGTLVTRICMWGKGSAALMSEEVKPRPKWLLNQVFQHDSDLNFSNCYTKYVSTGMSPDEVDRVYIGEGQSESSPLFSSMLVYELKLSGEVLTGEAKGLKGFSKPPVPVGYQYS